MRPHVLPEARGLPGGHARVEDREGPRVDSQRGRPRGGLRAPQPPGP